MENNIDEERPGQTNAAAKAEQEALMLKTFGQVIRTLDPLTNHLRRRVVRAVIGYYELKNMPEDSI